MTPSITHSSDLEDLALELGATVHHEDGSVFNASKRAGVQRMRRTNPEDPRTPAPPPPPAPDNSALIAALTQMVEASKAQVPQAPVVHSSPAQVVIQPPARCAWDFSFTRNRDGSIQSIRATPVQE